MERVKEETFFVTQPEWEVWTVWSNQGWFWSPSYTLQTCWTLSIVWGVFDIHEIFEIGSVSIFMWLVVWLSYWQVWVEVFWAVMLWRWRQYGLLKHWYPTTTLYSITTQKNSTCIFTATKTSNIILYWHLFIGIIFKISTNSQNLT